MALFQLSLSYETWEPVFGGNDVSRIFNSCLNTYPRLFYSSLPLIQVDHVGNNNSWIITPGIIIPCKRKRELYMESRNSKNPSITKFYKEYCKRLSEVIKRAKRLVCDKHMKI